MKHCQRRQVRALRLLPENFKFVFQGPNDLSTASSYNKTPAVTNPEKYDTGFIRIIPRGGNYEQLFEQSRQAVYDNAYFQNYTAKVTGYYQTYYTDVYNAEYKNVYNNTATRADVLQNFTTTYKATFESQKVEEFAAQQYYIDRYNALYNKRRDDTLLGLSGCTLCVHTESEEKSQVWAYNEVRKEIRNDKAADISNLCKCSACTKN